MEPGVGLGDPWEPFPPRGISLFCDLCGVWGEGGREKTSPQSGAARKRNGLLIYFFYYYCYLQVFRAASMDLAMVAAGEVQNVLSAMQKNLECPIWYGRGIAALGFCLYFPLLVRCCVSGVVIGKHKE